MALTITDRPIGYKLSGEQTVTLVEDYGGLALVNVTAHGLTNGTVIYLLTNKESYNGYAKVSSVIDVDSFTIETMDGDLIYWIADGEGYMRYQVLSHNWSCVHLPIVYKLSSDLFPYSQSDGVYEYNLYGFIDGYFAIGDLSVGALGYASLDVGDYVALLNHTNLFQVMAKQAPNRIVLNWDGSDLPDTTNTLDPSNTTYFFGLFQRYYNNYHVKVQIYAGLKSVHYWAAEKPYRLISTTKLVPDENNELMFSVSEELMTDIKSLTNNLLLDTLPNNIDAFTMFYITTQEVYDEGNGSGVIIHTGSIESDQSNFEGFAVNAKLEFKNLYSGYLSDYVVQEVSEGLDSKFLTLFENPVMFSGHYFDLSVILQGVLSDTDLYMALIIDWMSSDGTIQTSESIGAPRYSAGVYRFEITPNCDYAMASVYIIYGQDGPTPDITERKLITVDCDCADYEISLTWLNYLGGFDYWVFTAFTEHQVDIKESTNRTKNIFPNWPTSYGETANTIRQETSRKSCIRKTVRSQYVSLENLEALKYIKTSSLVQIIIDKYDLRTVLIDTDSFVTHNDGDKQYFIEFSMEYTDYIPAQRL